MFFLLGSLMCRFLIFFRTRFSFVTCIFFSLLRLYVFFWSLIKLLFAGKRAKIIFFPSIVRRASSFFLFNLHSTNQIFGHFKPPIKMNLPSTSSSPHSLIFLELVGQSLIMPDYQSPSSKQQGRQPQPRPLLHQPPGQ